MTQYFFDVDDGIHVTDSGGSVWSDLPSARLHAIGIAVGIAGSDQTRAAGGCAVIVTVREGPSQPVAKVRLVLQAD